MEENSSEVEPKVPKRQRHAFARLLLEITLAMVFVMIMTYSPGSHNSIKRLGIKSEIGDTPGQGGAELAHTTVRVTPSGFVIDGKVLVNREELATLLQKPGGIQSVLRIEPDKETINENLRWLLSEAGANHEIELQL